MKVHESSPVRVNDTRTIAGDDSYFFVLQHACVNPYWKIKESSQFAKIEMIHASNDTRTIHKKDTTKNRGSPFVYFKSISNMTSTIKGNHPCWPYISNFISYLQNPKIPQYNPLYDSWIHSDNFWVDQRFWTAMTPQTNINSYIRLLMILPYDIDHDTCREPHNKLPDPRYALWYS